MICDFRVSLISPPSSTLCPASPSLGWVAWVSLPHLLDRLRGLRYYVQLRLPLHLLGSLRLSLASRYLCWPPFGLCSSRLVGRVGSPRLRLAICCTGSPYLSGCSPTRSWRFSQVPRLPLYAHAPLAVSGGVRDVCHNTSRIHAFQSLQTVGFPRYHSELSMLSLWTTHYTFRRSVTRPTHSLHLAPNTPSWICTQVHCKLGGYSRLVRLGRFPVLTHWVTSTNFTESVPSPRFWI